MGNGVRGARAGSAKDEGRERGHTERDYAAGDGDDAGRRRNPLRRIKAFSLNSLVESAASVSFGHKDHKERKDRWVGETY